MSKQEGCACVCVYIHSTVLLAAIKCRMPGYWEGYSMSKQEGCVCVCVCVCVSIQLYFLLLLNVECQVTAYCE